MLCVVPAITNAGQPLLLRSQSPFTQVFGLPTYPHLQSPDVGHWTHALSVDVINHADRAATSDEAIELDGETYTANVIANFGVSERWTIGIDIPYLWHRPGHLDGPIKQWHDIWGISNNNRSGVDNRLLINYAVNQRNLITVDDSSSGIGDVRLSVSRAILGRQDEGTHMVWRATVKLPTGDSDQLHGSGATDLAWDVALQRSYDVRGTDLHLSAHLGLLALGNGEVLADLQKDFVPYGGISAVWATSPRLDLITQLQTQGRYFDSKLDELGGTTLQFAAGARYRWPGSNTALAIGLVEDLVSDVTPDIALHLQLQRVFR